MLMMLAWFWAIQKRGPADAHDAGMVLGPSKNVGGLSMLMMLVLFCPFPRTLAG